MRLFLFLFHQAFYTFGSLAFGTCVQLHHLLARGDSVAVGHTQPLIPNAFYLCSVGAYILRFPSCQKEEDRNEGMPSIETGSTVCSPSLGYLVAFRL